MCENPFMTIVDGIKYVNYEEANRTAKSLVASLAEKDKQIEELEADNERLKEEVAKLNIILYHRENGLSHPDLQQEIDKSKLMDLQAQLAKYGWVSVEDGLPEDNDNVLVLLKYATGLATLVGFYSEHSEEHDRWQTYALSNPESITHWMPIPDLPKKEGE